MLRLIIKHLPLTIAAWITNSFQWAAVLSVCPPSVSVDPGSAEVRSSFGVLFLLAAKSKHKHQQTRITSLPHSVSVLTEGSVPHWRLICDAPFVSGFTNDDTEQGTVILSLGVSVSPFRRKCYMAGLELCSHCLTSDLSFHSSSGFLYSLYSISHFLFFFYLKQIFPLPLIVQ